jgi:hypothetical protein
MQHSGGLHLHTLLESRVSECIDYYVNERQPPPNRLQSE